MASLEAILSADPVPEGASPDAAIVARAEAGDPTTLAALDTAGTALGVALSDMVNILDSDTVLLGPDAAVIGAALTSIDQVRQHPIAWLAHGRRGPATPWAPAEGLAGPLCASEVSGNLRVALNRSPLGGVLNHGHETADLRARCPDSRGRDQRRPMTG